MKQPQTITEPIVTCNTATQPKNLAEMNFHCEAVCMKLENDIAQHLEQGEFLALATIIERSGSAPRHAGAQMLVTRDLSVLGTIGGGQVESDVLAACLPVRKTGAARLMHFECRLDPRWTGCTGSLYRRQPYRCSLSALLRSVYFLLPEASLHPRRTSLPVQVSSNLLPHCLLRS